MKMKRHRFYACLLTVMTLAGFTACSSTDNDGVTDGQTVNGKSQLTLTINTPDISGSRAAITSDPSDEKSIHRITVGIFETNGNVRTIQEFLSGSGAAGSNTFSTGSSTTLRVVTNKLTAGDKVLVAVNAPSGLFTGVQTLSAFQDKGVNADRALATNFTAEGTVQSTPQSSNAPMYGESTLAAPTSSGQPFTSTVSVKHLTAKISLDDIEVAFDPKGSYSAATFTPTEIYVEHVVDGLNFNATAWKSGSLLSGTSKAYLTTGPISGVTLSGAAGGAKATMANKYYFYVTPSSNNVPSGSGANAVRIWIKGQFDPDGTGKAAATTVFYPVLVNANYNADGTATAANGDIYKVYPNKSYVCKVTIKTKGLPGSGDGSSQPEPGKDELKPETAQITVNVANWDSYDQTTIFE